MQLPNGIRDNTCIVKDDGMLLSSCKFGHDVCWPIGTLEPGQSRTVRLLVQVYYSTAPGTVMVSDVKVRNATGQVSRGKVMVLVTEDEV